VSASIRYLKARGLKLLKHEFGEQIHVKTVSPALLGTYRIRVSGYSAYDASMTTNFEVQCKGGFRMIFSICAAVLRFTDQFLPNSSGESGFSSKSRRNSRHAFDTTVRLHRAGLSPTTLTKARLKAA
jgi:hypothetical protein